MATIVTAPLRAVGRAVKGMGNGFARAGTRLGHGLTLVPQYLVNLLWLLSQSFLDLARQAYGANPALYAVLHVLSTAVSEPPLVAYTMVKGERGDKLDYDHPLAALIRRPNPFMTSFEMWELMTLHEGIAGRSCWWKERDNTGQIMALWPLRPDRIGPIYDLAEVISGWSYLIPGSTHYVPIPARDVLMTNLPDPAGESGGIVEGLGWVQVLAAEIGADNEATRFVGSLLANYAVPGTALTVKQSINDQATVDGIKYAFRREFGGANRGSPAVIDSDTTITPLGFNLTQLEFPALRDVSESRIAAAAGVPAALVGLHVGLKTGTNDATIVAQREYFAETTCENYWRRHEMVYTRDVAAEFGLDIDCEFDRTKVKALALQTAQTHDKLTDSFKNGAISYNEYREKVLGLPPLAAGGDRRVLPKGSIEIDENGDVIENSGAPADAPGLVTPKNPDGNPATPAPSTPQPKPSAKKAVVVDMAATAESIAALERAYAAWSEGESWQMTA